MEKSTLRKRVFSKLLWSPWTWVPAVLGVGAMLAGAALGSGTTAFYGFLTMLGSVGSLATRWLLWGDAIIEEELSEWEQETIRRQQEKLLQKERSLDDLDRRLQQDRDPTTEHSLRQLRRLYGAFRKQSGWTESMDRRSVYDISNKVENLVQACIISLQRSLQLWQTAQGMQTETTRKSLLAKREELLVEVSNSIGQLALTVDQVQALGIDKQSGEDLARLRQELDQSLDVARRVEQRMRSLESELGGELPRREPITNDEDRITRRG